ncbi:MAG TPA: presqualene diphosphate synthase HpnD [Burkholderiales bacterium]|jgi:phytoene synthase|nr:presqualene diphosphate synthase HpnD [Burkholderiales bacterium]
MTPDEYCQQRAAGSGSSFYYSFLFLPPEQRRAITALYAFCREVDDVVDDCSDPGVARMKLAWWRTEIAASFAGDPQHPVARALARVVKQYHLPQDYFHDIIDGMEMDLERNRYASFEALDGYCYKVAGVVGLMAAEVFGYRSASTLDYARTLGTAFQLTNIIRDVGEDARRDRIYLPTEDLDRFGVAATDVLSLRETDAFRALIAFEIRRARAHYERALALLAPQDRRSQRAGLVMAAIYRTLLDEIEADGCRVLSTRVSLTPLRKLWIAWRTWLTA